MSTASTGAESEAAPRQEDIFRHLDDLRTRTYEGAGNWSERVACFHRAVKLLDPVVRRVLGETDAAFLDGTAVADHDAGEDEDGGRWARWILSWPTQREAPGREGGGVQPVQVTALFARHNIHPHLSGTTAGMWPCQVTDEADAARQEPIVRAIVEAELHQRIVEGRWGIVPAFIRRHPT